MYLPTPTSDWLLFTGTMNSNSDCSDDIQNRKAICFFIAVQGGVPNVSLSN